MPIDPGKVGFKFLLKKNFADLIWGLTSGHVVHKAGNKNCLNLTLRRYIVVSKVVNFWLLRARYQNESQIMSDQISAGVTVHNLWPTQLTRTNLPGAEHANMVLKKLIVDQDAVQEDVTGQYLSQNLMALEHPAIKWLATCIDRAVLDYSRISNIDYSFKWHVQAWPNINVKGDYHNLHNHPHSWLSGTYYVNVPDQSAVKMHRTDLNPAEISFFDPRPQANMNAVKGDGQCDPEFRTLPKNGDLLLWPSFLHHLVHPNLVDDPRISISFNVIFKNPTSHF